MVYEIPGVAKICQVKYWESDKEKTRNTIIKTYVLQDTGKLSSDDPSVRFETSINLNIEMYDIRNKEISYRLIKQQKGKNTEYRTTSYVDDSMNLVQRETNNKTKIEAYNTYPCIHGGIIKERYPKKDIRFQTDSFFGWALNTTAGCTFNKPGQVDILLFRSLQKSDDTLPNYKYTEKDVVSVNINLYIANSVESAMQQKTASNMQINEPLITFEKEMLFKEIIP